MPISSMFERIFFEPRDSIRHLQNGVAVHTIKFSSADPLDHVCRALDVVRKMGFALDSMSVDEKSQNMYRVSIAFQAHGALTPSTLIARLASCVGICELTHTNDCARPARD